MNYRSYAKSYQTTSIETASPGKLVLMLYDGALRFMAAAKVGFQSEDEVRGPETISNNLIKAQNILTELQASLDLDTEGDFAINMYRLYDYMLSQLQEANIKKRSEPIDTVDRLLRQIRDAWEEMLQKQEDGESKRPLTSLSQSA